jgi:diacylglycerol kinase family enzyme
LIAVGGDGTLNEMINGVINSFKTENSYDWQKISEIKIGVYPGSGNDFARNIEDSSLKN